MIKKGLIAGVAMFAVGFGLNMVFQQILPSINAEYQNSSLFRPWDDPLMMAFIAYPFVFGIVLAYLWEKVKAKDPLEFAKLYFIIATIPGMLATYTSFQVSLLMIILWSVTGILETYTAGYVFRRLK